MRRLNIIKMMITVRKLKNTDEISCQQVTLFHQRCMCPAELQMDTRRWAKFYQGFDVYR